MPNIANIENPTEDQEQEAFVQWLRLKGYPHFRVPNETMKDCTIDHIVPISKGGLTTIENCRLAHRDCNLNRGNGKA